MAVYLKDLQKAAGKAAKKDTKKAAKKTIDSYRRHIDAMQNLADDAIKEFTDNERIEKLELVSKFFSEELARVEKRAKEAIDTKIPGKVSITAIDIQHAQMDLIKCILTQIQKAKTPR